MAKRDNTLPGWALARNAKTIESIQKSTKKGDWNLGPSECWWRDRYEILKSRGYMLRPRYEPGWVPSWLGNDRLPVFCEDSKPLMVGLIVQLSVCLLLSFLYGVKHPKTIDAVHQSSGTLVCIKKVAKGSSELEFCRVLLTDARRDRITNHCVPILDILSSNVEPEFDFIVMPFLRPFNDPPFLSVNEVLDFMRQTLEVRSTRLMK